MGGVWGCYLVFFLFFWKEGGRPKKYENLWCVSEWLPLGLGMSPTGCFMCLRLWVWSMALQKKKTTSYWIWRLESSILYMLKCTEKIAPHAEDWRRVQFSVPWEVIITNSSSTGMKSWLLFWWLSKNPCARFFYCLLRFFAILYCVLRSQSQSQDWLLTWRIYIPY